MEVEITINGRKRRFDVEPNRLLLNLVRDDLHLTGTKYGCGIGECGACTVHLDGEAVLACMVLAVDADGRTVETIEGVADVNKLDPVQEAYIEEGAIQCGFCTPGFIMTTKALLAENPDPSEAEIREYLKGNYCRCTGYVNIVRAVQSAARKLGS
ncbi:(2Fe-2S)-binding protein [Candidatus Bathyarchaeota archaeon]|nr:(2Fe-2S)-binding protein [Candidatus Bathyarchaeota archaeon]MBL7079557.1 (2Fe-2S)-binding protein [Candidatus Bathyarchaeota archaeon]